MTGRIVVAAAASFALSLASVGCLDFVEVPVEIPIQAKIDVSKFQRVLVAGFIGGGSNAIDANGETSRLLRSQLHTKSALKVVDADVISLVSEVDKKNGTPEEPPPAPGKPEELRIKSEKDLGPYETVFADKDYWKGLGEQYQSPLIVTGSILFTDISKSGMVSRPVQYTDPATGQTRYQEKQEFSDLKGYALDSKFVFIDGKTGEQLYTQTLHEETLYPTTQNTPALSSYFELMDKVLPTFLNTLSTQKIKGTRTLIK
jgi:hypothetical protein